jgi:averantin hydroxylase
VVVQPYAAFHSPSNFHLPDSFIPERFLDGRDSEFKNDNRDVLQPFSVGPRNCIGRNLANVEMRLILTRVLFNFDLELDEARTGNWLDQKAFALWEKRPLWVKLRPAR